MDLGNASEVQQLPFDVYGHVAVSADGTLLVYGSFGSVHVLDVSTGRELRRFDIGDANISAGFGVSEDGQRVFCVTAVDGKLLIHDLIH